METALKLAMILVVFVVGSESRIIRRETLFENDENMDCYISKHANCVQPNLADFDESLATPELASAFLSNRSKLEELANATQTTVECLDEERAKPVCQGIEGKEDIDKEVEFVAGFLATPTHIDILVNLSSSECFTNHSLVGPIEQQVSQCAMVFIGFMHSLGDVCIALDGMKDCWAESAASICGTAAGDFIQSAWAFAMEAPQDRAEMFQLPVPISIVEACVGHANALQRYTRALLEYMKR